jgi:hypothetical protein
MKNFYFKTYIFLTFRIPLIFGPESFQYYTQVNSSNHNVSFLKANTALEDLLKSSNNNPFLSASLVMKNLNTSLYTYHIERPDIVVGYDIKKQMFLTLLQKFMFT